MKVALANLVRAEIIGRLLAYLNDSGEDAGMISSNTFNMPYVMDGEECFVEVTAKVVNKKTPDECYQERDDYDAKEKLKAEKKAIREKEAAERKAKAAAKRAEKTAQTKMEGV